MTSVHQDLIARVSRPELNAILIDTPFGFQENADEIADRIRAYFRERVGSELARASLRHAGRATALEIEQFLSRLDGANYVFSGPGSPTYALRHWRNHGVAARLIEKVAQGGGCLAFASAAAIALGAYALPVYEIYKVGDDPSWTEGLDVLGEIGVRCAVLPHYDNREGGSHDTRFCWMGEPRLRVLESMLPDDVVVLGVDEYTACIIDVAAHTVTVRGRGGVTVRRRGVERRWERTTFALAELQAARGPHPALPREREREIGSAALPPRGRDTGLEQTRAWVPAAATPLLGAMSTPSWRPFSKWKASCIRGVPTSPMSAIEDGPRCVSSSFVWASWSAAARGRGCARSWSRWSMSCSRCAARPGVNGASTRPIACARSWPNAAWRLKTRLPEPAGRSRGVRRQLIGGRCTGGGALET